MWSFDGRNEYIIKQLACMTSEQSPTHVVQESLLSLIVLLAMHIFITSTATDIASFKVYRYAWNTSNGS